MGRRRDRDDDEDEKEELNLYKGAQARKETAAPEKVSGEKFLEMLDRVEPSIQSLNNSYNQFIAGAEKLPPIEKRKALDQLMASLTSSPKPTQSLQFRFQTMWTQYRTYADKWDKLMKDLESGKIKRVVERK